MRGKERVGPQAGRHHLNAQTNRTPSDYLNAQAVRKSVRTRTSHAALDDLHRDLAANGALRREATGAGAAGTRSTASGRTAVRLAAVKHVLNCVHRNRARGFRECVVFEWRTPMNCWRSMAWCGARQTGTHPHRSEADAFRLKHSCCCLSAADTSNKSDMTYARIARCKRPSS